jgi:hypothetical protein
MQALVVQSAGAGTTAVRSERLPPDPAASPSIRIRAAFDTPRSDTHLPSRTPMSDPITRAMCIALMLAPGPALAVSDPCPGRPAFPNMRYEEDWRFLADPACRTDPWDRAKYIDLGHGRSLSFGGDVRLRYERFSDPGFGRDRVDRDGYFLNRSLFHGHLRWNPRVEAFAQLESSDVNGRRAGPRANDRDPIDLNQLFVQWTAHEHGADHLTVRAGRQEVELGSAQFTSARDGLNDRLSFDGVRIIGEISGWRLHGMHTRVVPTRQGAFDDGSNRSDTLSGIFVARAHALLPEGNAVVYVNRRTRPSTQYASINQSEERITLGTRWWGNDGRWDYNYEAGRQTGSIGAGTIDAWYVSVDNGLTHATAPWSPRAGLRFNLGTGDRAPNDGVLGTFSPLFASTAYSGLAGLVGPSNSVSLAPSATLRPHEDHSLTLGVVGFWRQSTQDGTYNIFSEVQRLPGSSDARHVGTQSTLQHVWTPTRHVTVVTVLAWFEAGAFLRETPPGRSTSYFTTWWVYRF